MTVALSPNAVEVCEARYLRRDAAGRVLETPDELFQRVARAVSAAELMYRAAGFARRWEARFGDMLATLAFLPNSPTPMNAGTPLGKLSACFVLPLEDSMQSIFGALRDAALVQRTGGGTGFWFSRLRPAGERLSSTGRVASGPISFMWVFDCAAENVRLGGRRRARHAAAMARRSPNFTHSLPGRQSSRQ